MSVDKSKSGWEAGILIRTSEDDVYYIPASALDSYRIQPGDAPHAPEATFDAWFECVVELSGIKNALKIDWEFTPMGDGVGVEHLRLRERRKKDES